MPTWNTIALFLAATSVLVITPGPVIIYIITCTVERGYKAGLISVIGVGVGTLAHVIAAAIGLSAMLSSSMLAFTVVKYAGAAYLIYVGIRTLMTHQTAQQKNVFVPQRSARQFDATPLKSGNPPTGVAPQRGGIGVPSGELGAPTLWGLGAGGRPPHATGSGGSSGGAPPQAQSLTSLFAQGALINILNPKTALFFFAWLPRFIDPARGSVAGQTVFFGCLTIILGFCNDSVYVLLAGTASRWLRKNTRLLIIQRYFAGCVYLLLGITAAIANPK